MDIQLPSLGEGATTGTVVNIFVKEGDKVEKDQALMEIESDKAVAELPSPEAGTIDSIQVKEGDEVSEGDVLAQMSEGGGSDSDAEDDDSDDSSDGKAKEKEEPAEDDADEEDRDDDAADDDDKEKKKPKDRGDAEEDEESPQESGGTAEKEHAQRPPAAPSIRRMARDLGIDLHQVGGSGRGGRIDIADLRAHIAQLKKQAEQSAASSGRGGPALPETPDPAEFGDIESKSLPSIRKTIATRLSRTWPNLPQVTQFGEADIAELMRLKEKHGEAFEKQDAKLTLTAILLKLLPPLLKAHPYLNASLDLENEAVILKKYFHIGLAVDTEQGLLVPVLRDAGGKSLPDLARETADLAKVARDGRLDKKAMAGASFTLSNQGGLGGGAFTPLVPYPQAAILGVGRASERPVVVDDSLKTHPYLPLALSYDHRLIDGGEAARFMHDLIERLEHPDESFFEI